jgi:hypothetical protein
MLNVSPEAVDSHICLRTRRRHIRIRMDSGVCSKDIQLARRNAKRNRAATACSRCKSGKVKCSDYRPCKNCVGTEHSEECLSEISQPAMKRVKTLQEDELAVLREPNADAYETVQSTSQNLFQVGCTNRKQEGSRNDRSIFAHNQPNFDFTTTGRSTSMGWGMNMPSDDAMRFQSSRPELSVHFSPMSSTSTFSSGFLGSTSLTSIGQLPASRFVMPPPTNGSLHAGLAYPQGPTQQLPWPTYGPAPSTPFAQLICQAQLSSAAAPPVVLPPFRNIWQSIGLIPIPDLPAAPHPFMPSSFGPAAAQRWP